LQQKNDPGLICSALREFIDASHKNEDRYFAAAWEQASSICGKMMVKMLEDSGKFNAQGKNALNKYLQMVQDRTVHTGTPQPGEALEDFYKMIETNLKHIVYSLQQKNDPYLISCTLKEFIDASPKCGGRHYAVAWQQALTVCCGVKDDPLTNLEYSLGECRGLILETIIRELYPNTDHNVHMYNRALHDLGKDLGIPSCCSTKKFNDKLCMENYSKKNIEKRFYELYTPCSLIYDWLLPKLKSESPFRDDYYKLQKTLVPKDWKVPDEDKVPDLDKELKEEENWLSFLAKFVHNEKEELEPSAIRYLLEKEGIIYCRLKTKGK
jgi:hypothetical protein